MFIAIYSNKDFTERDSAQDIFKLPGKYDVFEVKNSLILQFKDETTYARLKIKSFEVTKFSHYLLGSEVEIFDHSTNKIHQIKTHVGKLVPIIVGLIKDLEIAATYPSLDAYLEIRQLQVENEDLKKENEKLKNKIKIIQKK